MICSADGARFLCTLAALASLSLPSAQAQSADNSVRVLYAFTGQNGDGFIPYATLAIGPSGGAIYGTTIDGGTAGGGVAFQLTPPVAPEQAWTETIIHEFGTQGVGPDGFAPNAMVFGHDGALYGTTAYGGPYGLGVVFRLARPAEPGGDWTETILYAFKGGADGAYPTAGVLLDGYIIYGPTGAGGGAGCGGIGCGTIFRLEPPTVPGHAGLESVLYPFTGASDGSDPRGLVMGSHGALYGTDPIGGGSGCAGFGCGTVFELTPPTYKGEDWTFKVLYTFEGGDDGAKPYGLPSIGSDGVLYGTSYGSTVVPNGAAFSLTPPKLTGEAWTFRVLYTFQGGTDDGANPWGIVPLGSKGSLVGVTSSGGISNNGVIFELIPSEPGSGIWTEKVSHRFPGGSLGMEPVQNLVSDAGGNYYGITYQGGIQYPECPIVGGCGVVFKLSF